LASAVIQKFKSFSLLTGTVISRFLNRYSPDEHDLQIPPRWLIYGPRSAGIYSRISAPPGNIQNPYGVLHLVPVGISATDIYNHLAWERIFAEIEGNIPEGVRHMIAVAIRQGLEDPAALPENDQGGGNRKNKKHKKSKKSTRKHRK